MIYANTVCVAYNRVTVSAEYCTLCLRYSEHPALPLISGWRALEEGVEEEGVEEADVADGFSCIKCTLLQVSRE